MYICMSNSFTVRCCISLVRLTKFCVISLADMVTGSNRQGSHQYQQKWGIAICGVYLVFALCHSFISYFCALTPIGMCRQFLAGPGLNCLVNRSSLLGCESLMENPCSQRRVWPQHSATMWLCLCLSVSVSLSLSLSLSLHFLVFFFFGVEGGGGGGGGCFCFFFNLKILCCLRRSVKIIKTTTTHLSPIGQFTCILG